MCFSAEASFTGGVVLSAIGVAAIKKVSIPSQTAFASVPLVFGIQQIAEGFVWMSFRDPAFVGTQKAGMYLFLFIARVLWPALMPFSVLMMEEVQKKKNLQRIMLAMGLSVSVYYSYCLLFLNVAPNILGHHVQYISDFPDWLAVPVFAVYLVACIVPLFISSIKRTRLLGILMFIACLITGIFYVEYLTSVWCFFAAIISVVILWIVDDKKNLSIE
ncbi:MAG: DUF6629 family protein [Bacteroidota bacterium]